MKIGNLVKPTHDSNFFLRSGYSVYDRAVVVSLEPFTLVSEELDMLWSSTIKVDNFKVVGEVDTILLDKCLLRMNNI